jgi:tetratricopeptide (TPR) repeat protein
MNERAWVVVPFANVTKSQDLDWLRDASVNLLTLDMGRWTDVDVVPDKRVADLIREAGVGRADAALTLNEGLAIARRAGASRLVMGDFLKLGAGARLVATVFDAKTGAKIRTVTRQATNADSLLTAFGPLAREVLAIPPPVDTKIGEIGTQNLDAYRSYLLGVKALNRFDLVEARKHLSRALQLDSTFALAHLQFANLIEWLEIGDDDASQHARAAARFGKDLPRRERMLIDAGVASADRNYPQLCKIARTLVAQDSTDIQAVFLLGECSFHDDTVVPSTADSTIGAFQGSWPTAMRSFQRVIELDPTYLGAFEHIIQMLQRQRRNVCDRVRCSWESWVLRSGDTLETVPVRVQNQAAVRRQGQRFDREKPSRVNHQQAARIAQSWVDADPTSEGAHVGRARAALMNGDLATAEAHLRLVPPRVSDDNLTPLRLKLEVAIKRGRGVEARAIFDSLVKLNPDSPANEAPRGEIEIAFGRFKRFDHGTAAQVAKFGPEAIAYQNHVGRAMLGIPSEGMERDEAAFYSSMRDSACNDACRVNRLTPTLVYSPHVPAVEMPALMKGEAFDDATDVSRALATHDTSRMRLVARGLDSLARARAQAQLLDHRPLVAALAYLTLADSSSALRMVRLFTDTSVAYMSITSGFIRGAWPMVGAGMWPRAMLLRADLAAAAGSREEAKTWYDKVIDLWSDADAEMKPLVERIRKSRAALGK